MRGNRKTQHSWAKKELVFLLVEPGYGWKEVGVNPVSGMCLFSDLWHHMTTQQPRWERWRWQARTLFIDEIILLLETLNSSRCRRTLLSSFLNSSSCLCLEISVEAGWLWKKHSDLSFSGPFVFNFCLFVNGNHRYTTFRAQYLYHYSAWGIWSRFRAPEPKSRPAGTCPSCQPQECTASRRRSAALRSSWGVSLMGVGRGFSLERHPAGAVK